MGVRSSEFTCTWTGSGASVGAWVCDAPKACDLTVMDKVHWPTEGAPYPAKRAGYGKVTVMPSEIWGLPSLWVKFYHLCVLVTCTTICLDNVPDSITSVYILTMLNPFHTFYISTHSVHFQKQSLSINSYLQTTVHKRVINPGNQNPFSGTEMHIRR